MSAEWAAVVVPLGLALLGATWRVGSLLSGIRADLKGLVKQVDGIQRHQDDHDKWHWARLKRGADAG
jgi:hypothetical protein